ncbi:MAG: primosomal replication protein N [Nitrosomonas sp.]|uniref:primosomal replication protein N n=1 Tax=Nitrosomonas sp. TaxID=42353 RepID=UPI0027319BA9|nr:primosomal replication protein N [Nitrosomonas sp.]MDP1550896.1 primosomal replication protein N [Nitrosomonas sp.]MDP1933780.1 primosomal replication protein N [Nitrosomonas sp.]MDP3280013.1 primosomal replication protein N [Nitrosomonas sp.]MDP3663525.1 primosomal replication protein N [Nitrosomonas sp.]MDZ4104806.1 primosomal replication protein N [Nitrosomonas sp.]
MDCNQTIICGRIAKLGVLRYTPAGVAVIEFTINHVSRQKEAGVARQIIFDILAVALGQLALTVAGFKINNRVKLTGFINRKSHMNHQLVLHTDHIELI